MSKYVKKFAGAFLHANELFSHTAVKYD